jgi:hypothetical protein
VRIKHRVKRNWIKMYDKWSVLRVETVINNPQEFRVLRSLCQSRTVDGRRLARFNPVSADDCAVFRAAMAGEHAISGFRNGDLCRHLYPTPAASPVEARRRCQRISRQIAKLRGHGLVAKVHSSRLYRVTPKGHRLLAAALRYRVEGFRALAAAA